MQELKLLQTGREQTGNLSLNRTMQELKCCYGGGVGGCRSSLNRTMQELKSKQAFEQYNQINP